MKRWTQIFKALANTNRLVIIKLLCGGEQKSVTEIASAIRVSLAGTSRHLVLLSNLDVLDSIGKDGHVFYFLNPKLPIDLKKALHLFLA